MNTSSNTKSRIAWVDLAKGITILLVIIGHTVSYNKYGSTLRGLIFSFHMPLFFILSSLTSRSSANREQFVEKIKKSARHLLVPALLTFLLRIVYAISQDHNLLTSKDYWIDKLYSLIFASGVDVAYDNRVIPGMGIGWFFFALFIGRTLYDWIHLTFEEKQVPIIAFLFSVAGIILGKAGFRLPFSMDIALAIVPLFLIGDKMKSFRPEVHPVRKLSFSGLIYVVTLVITFPNWEKWTYMELACRRYTLYPLGFICAVAGTFAVIEACFLLSRLGKLCSPLIFVGKHSLYLLCIHIMDVVWKDLWFIEGHQFQSAALRTVLDIAFFCIFILLLFGFRKIKSRKGKVIKT